MSHALKLYARLLKSGLHTHPVRLRPLLAAAGDLTLNDTASIFAAIPAPDAFAWNAIIRSHVDHASFARALQLFAQMRGCGAAPDHYTFPFVLKACGSLALPETGGKVQCLAIKVGVGGGVFVQNGVLSMYASCGLVGDAVRVFDEMRGRDLVSWSTLIACFASNGLFEEALGLFREMQVTARVEPDEVTMVSIVSAIASLGALELGRWVHCFVKTKEFRITISLGTALIDMYSKCGYIDGSIQVFEKMSDRNLLTWTALIKGLAEHGRCRDAVEAFRSIKESGLRPDYVTFIGVLSACSHGGLLEVGWEIFKSIKVDYGIEPGIEHYGCMVDLLGRKGLINEAYEFVEKMAVKPTSIIWRTLLGACVTHGNVEMAEQVSRKLQQLDTAHGGDLVLLSNVYGATGSWTEKARVRSLMKFRGVEKEPGLSLV